MLNMMIGIQKSVLSVSASESKSISSRDFLVKYSFELNQRSIEPEKNTSKSKRTKKSSSLVSRSDDKIYTFIDYAPDVFNKIRALFKLKNDEVTYYF